MITRANEKSYKIRLSNKTKGNDFFTIIISGFYDFCLILKPPVFNIDFHFSIINIGGILQTLTS